MAADVDQQDFMLGDLQGEGEAVAIGEADGLQALALAAEGMQASGRAGRGR